MTGITDSTIAAITWFSMGACWRINASPTCSVRMSGLGAAIIGHTTATAEYAANVYNVLFGNVLGISDADVSIITWSTLALVLGFVLIARPLFFASLDPEVAAARGVPVRLLGFSYLVLLALAVAVAVQVVGVLLIFALLVTPAAIAQDITTRPAVAAALAIVLAVLFTWLGLAVGYFTPYPVSFFITSFAFGTYVLVRGGRVVLARIKRHPLASPRNTQMGGVA